MCDRNRNQVVWLDRQLILREVWRVARPVALARSGNQLWVACDSSGSSAGAHRILCFRHSGQPVASFRLGPILDMVHLPRLDGVLVLTGSDAQRSALWICDREGRWWGPLPVHGASQLRLAESGVWILGAPDRVGWLEAGLRSGVRWDPLPEGLQTSSGVKLEGDRLWCRGASKSSFWRDFAVDSGGWGREEPHPWLPQELASNWPGDGSDRKPPSLTAWLEAHSIAEGPGGFWLCQGPESLWYLDPKGQPIVGQGGFGFLTDVVRWEGASP